MLFWILSILILEGIHEITADVTSIMCDQTTDCEGDDLEFDNVSCFGYRSCKKSTWSNGTQII